MSLAFRYRAATSGGDVVEGVVRAPDERGALDELRRRTLVPVSLERAGERGRRRAWTRQDDDVATAVRSVAALLEGGSALDRALEFAAAHARRPDVSVALGEVRDAVRAGRPLGQAVGAQGDLFGALAPAIIRAGEEGGRLDQALTRLADHLERARALRAQLRDALLYPALMGVVSAAGVVVLLTFVVPRFVALLSDVGGALPLSTRALVGASTLVVDWWWAWAPGAAAGAIALRRWLATPAGRRRWHAARLTWPVTGDLELSTWTARFARALAVLLASGSPLLAALRVARDGVLNEALRERLDEATRGVERGERLAASLQGVLPPLAVQLLAVGEEGGTLDTMATRVADVHDAEVQRRLRSLVSMVEPLLIVCFGALVGFIALAMLQAIYSINASVL